MQRNRWKRVLREAFRLSQHQLPDIDFICLPRPTAEPRLRDLLATLPKLAARLDRKLSQSLTEGSAEEQLRQP